MDAKRIEKAKLNFNNYLVDSLITKTKFNKIIYETYLRNSYESLKSAELLFKQKIPLWTIVTSYYSMFYIANALIYLKGYKTKHKIVHQIINETLIALCLKDIHINLLQGYEEEKEKALGLAETLLENYEYEKNKRSRFQYETTDEIKLSKAKTSLKRAKEFVTIIRKILSDIVQKP